MKNSKKKLFILFAIIMSFAVTGCNDDDDENGPTPGENEVMMQNTSFVPSSITVVEGTTVTWTNQDNIAHTTTSNDGLWDSGNMNQGDTFSYTFEDPGTYSYECTIHPNVMTGTVVVQSSTANSSY